MDLAITANAVSFIMASTAFIAAAAQVAVGQDLFALQDALDTASNRLPRAMPVARGELRACCLLFALQMTGRRSCSFLSSFHDCKPTIQAWLNEHSLGAVFVHQAVVLFSWLLRLGPCCAFDFSRVTAAVFCIIVLPVCKACMPSSCCDVLTAQARHTDDGGLLTGEQ